MNVLKTRTQSSFRPKRASVISHSVADPLRTVCTHATCVQSVSEPELRKHGRPLTSRPRLRQQHSADNPSRCYGNCSHNAIQVEAPDADAPASMRTRQGYFILEIVVVMGLEVVHPAVLT